MNKKIITIGLIALLLFSTPVYALNTKISSKKELSEEKIESNNDNSTTKININQAKNSFLKIIDNNDNNKNFKVGWIKVESEGKGLFLSMPLNIIRINVPIPTPQFPNFFPFRFQFFLTLCVYNDTNASTKITYHDGTVVYINQSHSLVFGMFKIQAMKFLEILLDSGIIDGFQRSQEGNTAKGDIQKGPIAKIIYNFLNRTFKRYPFIDISDETVQFLETLKGKPAMYRPQIRIFDMPSINKIRGIVESILGGSTTELIFTYARLYGFMFPSAYFWNRMPIRTSIIGFKIPLELNGFTPYIGWSNSPKLLPLVQKIQDNLPNIFYDV